MISPTCISSGSAVLQIISDPASNVPYDHWESSADAWHLILVRKLLNNKSTIDNDDRYQDHTQDNTDDSKYPMPYRMRCIGFCFHNLVPFMQLLFTRVSGLPLCVLKIHTPIEPTYQYVLIYHFGSIVKQKRKYSNNFVLVNNTFWYAYKYAKKVERNLHFFQPFL